MFTRIHAHGAFEAYNVKSHRRSAILQPWHLHYRRYQRSVEYLHILYLLLPPNYVDNVSRQYGQKSPEHQFFFFSLVLLFIR